MTGWMSIVLAFVIAMGLGLQLVAWLGAGAFFSGCIGIGLYLFFLLFLWFALDGLERK